MKVNRRADVREQYKDSSNLGARIGLHARFSTDAQGWNAWVFEQLALAPGERVVEVGCGPALLWRTNRAGLPSGVHVTLTDMSPGMVEEARTALDDERFTFEPAEAQSLPFPDASADVLVANHMLYHVPDLDAALREFARVLALGGRLVAATNGSRHMPELIALLGDAGLSPTRWRYVELFGLENGVEPISRYFEDVRIIRHPDTLVVTDADAVVAYIASLPRRGFGEDERAEVRRRVQDVIDEHGSFDIHTDAGVITGRKR